MKLSIHSAAAAAALVSSLALQAFAGPGPQYWQSQANAASSVPAAGAAVSAGVCSGSKEVPVTVKVAAWANGRGPLVDKQIGTKRVCSVCPVAKVAITGWSNGRGPETKTETVATGAEHDCTACCPATKS